VQAPEPIPPVPHRLIFGGERLPPSHRVNGSHKTGTLTQLDLQRCVSQFFLFAGVCQGPSAEIVLRLGLCNAGVDSLDCTSEDGRAQRPAARSDGQVFDENLDADADEDKATHDLHAAAESQADAVAEQHA